MKKDYFMPYDYDMYTALQSKGVWTTALKLSYSNKQQSEVKWSEMEWGKVESVESIDVLLKALTWSEVQENAGEWSQVQ